jgi:hypothetical protein
MNHTLTGACSGNDPAPFCCSLPLLFLQLQIRGSNKVVDQEPEGKCKALYHHTIHQLYDLALI